MKRSEKRNENFGVESLNPHQKKINIRLLSVKAGVLHPYIQIYTRSETSPQSKVNKRGWLIFPGKIMNEFTYG